MRDDHIGRREAMRRALVVLGAAAVAPAVVAGCGEDGGGGGALSCTSTEGLAAAQAEMRRTQHYVDHSPHADRKCDGCRFYTAAAQAGSCGGCQVLAGPIHPDGYCDLYAASA